MWLISMILTSHASNFENLHGIMYKLTKRDDTTTFLETYKYQLLDSEAVIRISCSTLASTI